MSSFVDIEDMAGKYSSSKSLRKEGEKEKMKRDARGNVLFVTEGSSAWSELEGRDRHYEAPLSDDDMPELAEDEVGADELDPIQDLGGEKGLRMEFEKTFIRSGGGGREGLSLMNTRHIHLPAPTGPLPERKRNIYVPMREPDVSTDEIMAEINAFRDKPATREDLKKMSDQVGSLAASFSQLISGRKSSHQTRVEKLSDHVVFPSPYSSSTPMHQERRQHSFFLTEASPPESKDASVEEDDWGSRERIRRFTGGDWIGMGSQGDPSMLRGKRTSRHIPSPTPSHMGSKIAIGAPIILFGYGPLRPAPGHELKMGMSESRDKDKDEDIHRGPLQIPDLKERDVIPLVDGITSLSKEKHDSAAEFDGDDAGVFTRDFFAEITQKDKDYAADLSSSRKMLPKAWEEEGEEYADDSWFSPRQGIPLEEVQKGFDEAMGVTEEENHDPRESLRGGRVMDPISGVHKHAFATDWDFEIFGSLPHLQAPDDSINARWLHGEDPGLPSGGSSLISNVHASIPKHRNLIVEDTVATGHKQFQAMSVPSFGASITDGGGNIDLSSEDVDEPLPSSIEKDSDNYLTPMHSQKATVGAVIFPVGPTAKEVPSPPIEPESHHGGLGRVMTAMMLDRFHRTKDWKKHLEESREEREDFWQKLRESGRMRSETRKRGTEEIHFPHREDSSTQKRRKDGDEVDEENGLEIGFTRNVPKSYPQDPRMGGSDEICDTCGEKDCTGHLGDIQLPDSLPRLEFVDEVKQELQRMEILSVSGTNPGSDLTEEKMKEAEEFLRRMLREENAHILHVSASGKERRQVRSDPQVHLPGERKMYMHGGMYTDIDMMGIGQRRVVDPSPNRRWEKLGRGRDTVPHIRMNTSDLIGQMIESIGMDRSWLPIIFSKDVVHTCMDLAHPLGSMINIPSLIYSAPSPVQVPGTHLFDAVNLLGRGQKRAVEMMLILIRKYQASEGREHGRGWIYSLLTDHNNHSYSTEE